MDTHTSKLMGRVAVRQRLAALGRSFHLFLLCAAGAYGLALLASRLLGLIPDHWRLLQVPLLAAVALAAALAFHRRPAPRQTARLIDQQAGTKDLFLTAALIRTAAGAYKPLVLRDAEQSADTIEPRAVAPFHWWGRTRTGALALAALCAGILWLPQFDPFGRQARHQQKVAQRKKLEQSRKATSLRLAALKAQGDNAKLSKAVLKATEDLKKTLKAMKPADQKGNFRKLTAQQAALNQMWRKAGQKQAAEALKQNFEPQQFGEGQGRKVAEWKKQLQQGRTDAMQRELEDLKKMAEKLAKMPDGAARRALEQKLNQELKDLSDFASSQAGNPALNAALQRAMEQLAMSDVQGLSKDALRALQQSLQLSEEEMKRLAQSVRDMQSLEQALQTLQLARRLNQSDPLNGGQYKNCATLADYEALYRQLMAERGLEGMRQGQGSRRGRGPGMGGPGEGEGGVAPENPSVRTAFKSERERTSLTAGRILLSMKTRGLSQPGEATRNYQQYVNEVKQGVSEAIVHEQIPPAYHDAIRRYFDTLKANNGQPPAE